EEGIEVLVRQRIGLRGLGHVHAVVAHDGADQPVLPRHESPARAPVDQARQEAMRKDVLQQDLESHPAKYTGLPERFTPTPRARRSPWAWRSGVEWALPQRALRLPRCSRRGLLGGSPRRSCGLTPRACPGLDPGVNGVGSRGL